MFIGYFTERPYQDENSGYFGAAGRDITDLTMSNAQYDPKLGSDLYNRYLDEKVYAEEMGFDGLMLNEHHSTPFCMGGVMNLEADPIEDFDSTPANSHDDLATHDSRADPPRSGARRRPTPRLRSLADDEFTPRIELDVHRRRNPTDLNRTRAAIKKHTDLAFDPGGRRTTSHHAEKRE